MLNLSKVRGKKMIAQGGRCYYCGLPMWDKAAIASLKTARGKICSLPQLRCTAEHLHPRSEGGNDSAVNIVAACWYCNWSRHRVKKPRSPQAHRDHVRKRMADGRWLVPLVRQAGFSLDENVQTADIAVGTELHILPRRNAREKCRTDMAKLRWPASGSIR